MFLFFFFLRAFCFGWLLLCMDLSFFLFFSVSWCVVGFFFFFFFFLPSLLSVFFSYSASTTLERQFWFWSSTVFCSLSMILCISGFLQPCPVGSLSGSCYLWWFNGIILLLSILRQTSRIPNPRKFPSSSCMGVVQCFCFFFLPRLLWMSGFRVRMWGACVKKTGGRSRVTKSVLSKNRG
jgi:hypothetical protein